MLSHPQRNRAARALLTLTLAAFPAMTCQAGTQNDIAVGQMMLDLTDAVNALREETSLLQFQVDSLRTQAAQQDTLLRQLSQLVPR